MISSEDYDKYFRRLFKRQPTHQDVTDLLKILYHGTNKELLKMQEINLTFLVAAIQELSPEITEKSINEAFSRLYNQELHETRLAFELGLNFPLY